MNAETFQRAAEIIDHQRLCTHEAAHCAAALLLGLEVDGVEAPYLTAETVSKRDPSDPAGRVLIRRPDNRDGLRKYAITAIAGPLVEGKANWPPSWPLSSVPDHGDETDLSELVKTLDLDQDGYAALVDDTHALIERRDFTRLHVALEHLLEQHGRLDAATVQQVKATFTEGGEAMQHKRLNVIDTEISEGEMLALASTWQVDRVMDRVVPGAYSDAVSKIKAGETLPLVWQHDSSSPTNFVGEVIDADETHEGLRVRARFDLDDDAGRKAYKLVKRGSIKALSIGYRVLSKRRAAGGVTELLKIDLSEVSLVLAPANEGARVLAVKGSGMDVIELADSITTADMLEVKRQARTMILTAMGTSDAKLLRSKAQHIARQHTPVTIATFDC